MSWREQVAKKRQKTELRMNKCNSKEVEVVEHFRVLINRTNGFKRRTITINIYKPENSFKTNQSFL